MNTREFLISTSSALGLSLTAGCADPLLGAWDVDSVTDGEGTMDYPYSYTAADGASFNIAGVLVVEKGDAGMTGTLAISYAYTDVDGNVTDESDVTDLTVTKSAKGAYDILNPEDDGASSILPATRLVRPSTISSWAAPLRFGRGIAGRACSMFRRTFAGSWSFGLKKRRPEIPELATWQVDALAVVAAAPIARDVVFSGGAALAAVHLHHGLSADLDFFLEREVEPADLHPVATDLRRQGVTTDLSTAGPRVSLVLSRAHWAAGALERRPGRLGARHRAAARLLACEIRYRRRSARTGRSAVAVHEIAELPVMLRPVSLAELAAFFEQTARLLTRRG